MVSETDMSSTTPVHVFYNGLIPEEFILDPGRVNVTYVYLMSVDKDEDKARQDYDAGQ